MDTLINWTMFEAGKKHWQVYTKRGPFQSGILSNPSLMREENASVCEHPRLDRRLCPALEEPTDVKIIRNSAFILDFSDWWNQATGGLVLVDLVGHVSAHGLDLNVPWVGIFWFICKPFLFWRREKGKKGRKDSVSLKKWTKQVFSQPFCLSLSAINSYSFFCLESKCQFPLLEQIDVYKCVTVCCCEPFKYRKTEKIKRIKRII